jgi:hypothetical protein
MNFPEMNAIDQPPARKRLEISGAAAPGGEMPAEAAGLLRLANAALRGGDLRGAADRLGEALALAGDRPELLSAYGHLQLTLGQAAVAEDVALRSAAIAPNHGETLKLLGRLWLAGRRAHGDLEPLPGCEYAKYALPLDYPPSRRLAPRWGHGRPVHPELAALFRRNEGDYRAVIGELRTLTPFLQKIPATYAVETAAVPGWVGPPVNPIDLALLYYFVWKHRPATYLEIGSGSTTSFARRAVADHGLSTRIVSIDPQPRSGIDGICDAVIRDGLETLADLQVFSDLQPGDIVFLDGSHRCFMNSDVTVFFLDVLPRLRPGVIVHIHDISLPFDYPDMFTNWYWNEQYVLAAYLLGMRDRVRILMPSQYVSGTPGLSECLHPPLLEGVGDPEPWLNGGSFWFTQV